ncbi:fasciclin-like arabinogalactan protein 12 [Punica granatum]|uniref:FAS1 domain-containing protein n=2 Tax=Punica granatum TaxID=22663 RepID=A0A218XGT6_PUNGR|nr:fasciclin-like arabinogalactan protein 12 [Punica granatum]OWM84177.1 hypothetical protein CDL15_Pgr028169 [Punica granatum]PKI62601.1 hypothetical protein CRG98_017023 [Punica granatum]
MVKLVLLSLLVAFFLLQCGTTSAQPAQAPAPAGPDNITKVLEKAGQFTVFLKLMKSTAVADQINAQLNNSNNGLTVFAPTDNAFASLRSGTLNSLSNEDQVELIQFHVIPNFLSTAQFQTVSNPLRTQAGGSGDYEFPMNITTSGNQVNVSTGVTNAAVDNTIFSDGQLAVYQVDQVLLPMSIFGAKPPAPAPAPAKSKKKSAAATTEGPAADSAPVDASEAVKSSTSYWLVIIGAMLIGKFYL